MRHTGAVQVVLLGGVAVVGSVVALASAGFAFDGGLGGETSAWVFGIASLCTLGAWAGQWRFDRLAAAQVGLFMAFITSGGTAALVFFGAEKHPVALMTAVVSGLGCVGLLVFLVRSQFGPNVAGNPLADLFAKESISELDGVQFVVSSAATDFGGAITLVLQNCFDAPRELEVTLASPAGARQSKLKAGPLAVVRAEFPIAISSGSMEVEIRLALRGSGGRRVRTWVARTWENATSTGEQVALLALGVLKWGGGLKVTFTAGTSSPPPSLEPVIVDLTDDPMVRTAIKRTAS